MVIPKYLEAFRQAAREVQTREKSEIGEKKGEREGLISLNSLISHPAALQNASCAVCGATDDLWQFGELWVHLECAKCLPKPEPAKPTAAYRAVSASPDGTACKVDIVELPAAGLRYRRTYAHLQIRKPDHVPADRWKHAVDDGRKFLPTWGRQAESLGWDSRDLFGLHAPLDRPHPSYSRLSRYDCTGLVWLLQGKEVVAFTADTATIRNPTSGSLTTYRRINKPTYGPRGDSLGDFTG
jgi:hypothetical protein